jgi:hypothetical protein
MTTGRINQVTILRGKKSLSLLLSLAFAHVGQEKRKTQPPTKHRAGPAGPAQRLLVFQAWGSFVPHTDKIRGGKDVGVFSKAQAFHSCVGL